MYVRVSTCWGLFLGMAMSSAYISFADNAIAQITPDSSLSNNSRVTSSGNTSIIEGGTQAGGNLFHSFQQFSIPTGNTAYFKNASEIRNIISRVTGGSISNIDGTIRATANLFLINPNGIIFGQNARLEIGGSFLASTASSLKFADNFEFSATNPQPTPLLTISVPIGLQFPTNPGRITVQGDSQGISGLQVPSNQTLALVGGDISLEGATLKTTGGRIELGSVTGTGLVNLTPINKGFSLGYGAVQNGGNIQLSQQASVDASGEGGGDIQVWGRRVTLSDGSQVKANTQGGERGGALVVNGLELVELIGTSADGDFHSGLLTQSEVGATGAAGDVTINTHQLLLKNGAQVSASTFGAGKGGNLAVNADSVQVIGTSSPDNQFLTGLYTQVAPITIGGRMIRATGTGGDITINTHDLLIENGGQIQAATLSTGNAGNLMVNADTVQLIGTVTTPFGVRGSGLVTSANQNATGAAGNIMIKTQQLLVRDGARVNVSSQGKGNAGNLTVNARSIYLNNNATLSADTTSTESNQEQATINISSKDLILRRSNITTTGTGSQVIGGNIKIDTAVLAAVENSQISADSAKFRGGKVTINTGGIFRSPDTQITATGASPELSGTVQINSPDIDPSRGLVQLPTRVVDASTKIVSSCAALASAQSSEFVVTGRGGLPSSPYEPLSGDVLWSDTRFSTITEQHPNDKTPTASVKHPSKSKAVALVPATGWVINNIGEVTLISWAPNATPSVTTTAACLSP